MHAHTITDASKRQVDGGVLAVAEGVPVLWGDAFHIGEKLADSRAMAEYGDGLAGVLPCQGGQGPLQPIPRLGQTLAARGPPGRVATEVYKRQVASYILDFDGDLYGHEIRVEFFKRLRGERRFPSLEALANEIGRNADQTRAYFRSLN